MEAELVRDVDHRRHLIGAVAMVLDADLALQHAHQRIEGQVPLGRVGLLAPGDLGMVVVPAAGVVRSPPIAAHIAHFGRRGSTLGAIDPLGVLAARHLKPIGRAGELHPLGGDRGHVLEDDRAAAEQVGGSGQDLQRRHAAGAGAVEAGIGRPHRVFGPDVGGIGVGGLVAVRQRRHGRRGIDAEVGMAVEHARRHPAALAVDHLGACRNGRAGRTHGGDLAARHHDHPAVDLHAGRGQDVGPDDRRRVRGQGMIGGREGVAIDGRVEAGRQGLLVVRRRRAGCGRRRRFTLGMAHILGSTGG